MSVATGVSPIKDIEDPPVLETLGCVGEAMVRLSVPTRIMSRVVSSLAPFVTLRGIAAIHEQPIWRIAERTENDPVHHLERHEVRRPDEPLQQVWIHPLTNTLILECQDNDFLALMFTRLASHVLRLVSLRKGHLFVHAAAVAVSGRAIAIAGVKKSGKTTLTLAMIQRFGAGFICNDNLSLTRWQDGVVCHGWPRSLRVRADTADLIGFRTDRFLGHEKVSLAHPLNRGLHLPTKSDGVLPAVVHVFPCELQPLYGAQLIASMELSAIVFSQTTAPSTGPTLERLSADQAQALIGEHSYPSIEIPGIEHAPYLKNHFLPDLPPERPLDIASRVPAYLMSNGLSQLDAACNLLRDLVRA